MGGDPPREGREGMDPSVDEPLGELLPRLGVEPPGPRSRELSVRLADVESRNVTWRGPGFPVFWARARGANVVDADGNVYVDLTAAFGVAAAGHAHPAIVDAVRRQCGRLMHGMGDVHPPVQKVALLERLRALAPWSDSRAVLASSGSEAVEIALKTAQLATGRPGVVAFRGGYHGLTLGALSTTAREDFRHPFRDRLPSGVTFVPFPDGSYGSDGSDGSGGRDGSEGLGGSEAHARGKVGGAGDPDAARRSLSALDAAFQAAEAKGEAVGCVIVEPIQGRGGVRVPPPGFLAEVAARARRAGALLILDEIFTGLGRTGALLGLEHEAVVPDLLCLGKALGGGLPLSACLAPRAIMDAWPASQGEALHTSTFLGHPLACASAMAFLEVLEGEGLVARSREVGDWLRLELAGALAGMPSVAAVRGRGLFIGVELARPADSGSDRGAGLVPWEGGGALAAAAALRRGLLVLPAGDRGEVVELTPPLTISRDQLAWSVGTLADAIGALRP